MPFILRPLALAALAAHTALAAPSLPLLTVPAAPAGSLPLAVRLPAGAKLDASKQWGLAEADRPGRSAPGLGLRTMGGGAPCYRAVLPLGYQVSANQPRDSGPR